MDPSYGFFDNLLVDDKETFRHFGFARTAEEERTASEKAILANHLAGFDASALERMGLNRVTTPEELVAMQQAIRGVRVDDSLLEYIADIVGRTRSHR